MTIWQKIISWFKSLFGPQQIALPAPLPVEPVAPPLPPSSEPAALPIPNEVVVAEPKPDLLVTPTPVKLTASFDTAMLFVLPNEGGYSNDPDDSGGPTNYGITLEDYSEFLNRGKAKKDQIKVTAAIVKAMPKSDALKIYAEKYWFPEYEQLPQAIATAICDWGVLHGTYNARVLAQTVANALGAKPALALDGNIGPRSIAALNAIPAHSFVSAYGTELRAYFKRLVAADHTQKKFLDGWNARADRLAHLA